MDNERKQWQQELKRKLSELIEPAKVINQLGINHPDKSYLLEDVIQVLRRNDGDSLYISGDDISELSQLQELLQLIARLKDIFGGDYPSHVTIIRKNSKN